jgi:membrane protein required for colicin V production
MLYSGRNEHRGEGQRRVVNTFDIVVVAVVGGLTFLGLWKGMVKQLVALAGVVAGYMIAMRFYGPASRFLTSFHPGTAKVICFVAIFVACILCAHILGWAAGKLFGISGLGFLNRIGGGLVGFVKGCVIVSLVVIVFIAFLPENSSLFKGSSTIRYILPVVEIMKNTTPGDVKARYTEKVKKLKSVWDKQK